MQHFNFYLFPVLKGLELSEFIWYRIVIDIYYQPQNNLQWEVVLGRYYTIISILCKKIELFPSAGQLKDQSNKHMFVRVFLKVCNFFIWYIKSVSVFYFDCPRIFHHKICSSRKKISVLITTVYWPRNNNFVKCEINDDFLLCLHRFIPFL